MMERRIIKLIFLVAFLATALGSCYYDNEEELYPVATECETDSLNYNSHISSILNAKCATPACHGGSQNPNLTNFTGVDANKERIKIRSVDLKSMPPSSSTGLTDCEIKQLESWFNSGAPQN